MRTQPSIEDFLKMSYSPEREYRDGVLVERNIGEREHALLEGALAAYLFGRRKQWNIEVFIALTVRMRETWYAIPDVCAYRLPVCEEPYPSHPPLLWIEILSKDDPMTDVWAKAKELVENGVPYVWIIDPHTLESELWTTAGMEPVPDKTLRLVGSPIVIPLAAVIEE